MASGAPSDGSTRSSAPAPAAAPMDLSGIDLAQLQANGLQAVPGVDPAHLMNILKYLPGVFTKVRPLNSLFFPRSSTEYTWSPFSETAILREAIPRRS
ncbi:hypothetical protein K438DRAFT_1730059 [Mycena galopus ATCC 62051]|nr:hypothetical protein K438DRAFT_1730059 [Mycena galopus ATCC 62051]